MTDQSTPKTRTAGAKGAEVTVQTTGLSIERLYTNVPARWGKYVFSDDVVTRLVPETKPGKETAAPARNHRSKATRPSYCACPSSKPKLPTAARPPCAPPAAR